MKRSTFIWLSAASVASVYLPSTGCSSHYKLSNKAIAQPHFLAYFCDDKTIKTIGTAYKHQVPAEESAQKLARLILTDKSGHAVPETTNTQKLEALLDQKITHEFESGQTVMVNGWVLSQTEARQCALYASTQA
jgi:hypothetical protein